MKIRLILLIIICVTNIYSLEIKYDLKNQNLTLEEISLNQVWQKLLYINDKSSEINTKDYFISKEQFNAKNELIKTINSYELIDIKDYNNSPRCKFPARFYWLSKFVKFPDYKIIDEKCDRLNKYIKTNNIKSISAVLVSGYLGNPASTFGHSFFKLNKKNEETSLFDTSINYGALVPENENIVRYIFKGIFGGYEAGFSDKYFYTQDLVYNHTEFRDMWDYELNLSDEQIKFIILHLWEILGKKFDYYFLDKNCGYRVSQLIEIITNEKIIDTTKPWYVPVETFYKLEEKKDLVKNLKYVPSYQAMIFEKFNLLNSSNKNIVKNIIENKFENLDILDNYENKRKIEIINFLIDYIKYLEIKEKDNQKFQEQKNKILLKRLSLPISNSIEPIIEVKDSPAKSNKLRIFEISNKKYEGIDSYQTLEFTVFSIESLGRNSFDFNELTVFNTSLGIQNSKVFIDKFKIIDIKKYNSIDSDLEDSLGLSWKMDFGFTKINENKKLENSLYFSGDLGKTKSLRKDFLIYMMLNTSAYTRNHKYEIKPYIGFRNELFKDTKFSLETGYLFSEDKDMKYINSKLQYNFMKNYALNLEYEDKEYSNYKIALKYFF